MIGLLVVAVLAGIGVRVREMMQAGGDTLQRAQESASVVF